MRKEITKIITDAIVVSVQGGIIKDIAENRADQILELLAQEKQNWEKEIENLIAQEINIANCHNQSTSRLTHLAVKISKLNSK